MYVLAECLFFFYKKMQLYVKCTHRILVDIIHNIKLLILGLREDPKQTIL